MGQMGEPCISKKKISVFPHSQNSFPIFYSIREGFNFRVFSTKDTGCGHFDSSESIRKVYLLLGPCQRLQIVVIWAVLAPLEEP